MVGWIIDGSKSHLLLCTNQAVNHFSSHTEIQNQLNQTIPENFQNELLDLSRFNTAPDMHCWSCWNRTTLTECKNSSTLYNLTMTECPKEGTGHPFYTCPSHFWPEILQNFVPMVKDLGKWIRQRIGI